MPLIRGESKEKKKPKKAENQGIQNRVKPKEKTVRINSLKGTVIAIPCDPPCKDEVSIYSGTLNLIKNQMWKKTSFFVSESVKF